MFRNLFATALLAPTVLVAQALPKAETLLDRQIEVSGGKAAHSAKRTCVMKGTMEIAAMGLKGSLVIQKAEPNLSVMEVEFQGLGKLLEGFDGRNAWSYSAMQGPQIKTGDERALTEQGARFHSENWREDYQKVETVGQETVEGEPCYKVLATPKKGPEMTIYLSVKRGLLVKTLVKMQTAMGELNAEGLVKDYKTVGDVLVPHTLVQNVAGQTITLTFQTVEWNVTLPKTLFDPPAEVKALLEPKPAAK